MNEYLQILLTAVFTGAGTAIGIWISNKALIKHLDDIINRLRSVKNGRESTTEKAKA